jgi:hypothetical protein
MRRSDRIKHIGSPCQYGDFTVPAKSIASYFWESVFFQSFADFDEIWNGFVDSGRTSKECLNILLVSIRL